MKSVTCVKTTPVAEVIVEKFMKSRTFHKKKPFYERNTPFIEKLPPFYKNYLWPPHM